MKKFLPKCFFSAFNLFCRHSRRVHRDQSGQVLIFSVLILFTLVCFLALVANVGHRVTKKIQVQTAADAAVYSGATWMARGMNFSAVLNVGQTQGLALIIFIKAFTKTSKLVDDSLEYNIWAAKALIATGKGAVVGGPWLKALTFYSTFTFPYIGGLVAQYADTIDDYVIPGIKTSMEVLGMAQQALLYVFPLIAHYEANHMAGKNGADELLPGSGIRLIFIPIWQGLPAEAGEFKDICYHTYKEKIPDGEKHRFLYDPESDTEPFFYGYETFLKWQKMGFKSSGSWYKSIFSFSLAQKGTADAMGMKLNIPIFPLLMSGLSSTQQTWEADKIEQFDTADTSRSPSFMKGLQWDISLPVNKILASYWIVHTLVMPSPIAFWPRHKSLSYDEICGDGEKDPETDNLHPMPKQNTFSCDECQKNNGDAHWIGGTYETKDAICADLAKNCDKALWPDKNKPPLIPLRTIRENIDETNPLKAHIYPLKPSLPTNGTIIQDSNNIGDNDEPCWFARYWKVEEKCCLQDDPDCDGYCTYDYDEDGNITKTNYSSKMRHFFEYWTLISCEYECRDDCLKKMDDFKPDDWQNPPRPMVLKDDWEKYSVFSAAVFKKASGYSFMDFEDKNPLVIDSSGAASIAKTPIGFGDSRLNPNLNQLWGTASAEVFCASQADLFNQDWHVRLVPFSLERVFFEAGDKNFSSILDHSTLADLLSVLSGQGLVYIPDFKELVPAMSH